MVARNEIIFRWSLYAAAALALCLVQGFLLQFLRLFGAMPFLFPAVAACVGMFEGPFAGAAFGLILGVACDLTVAAPIPCFYTLIFPLAGLLAALIAHNLLPAGFVCALAVCVLAFVLTDGFHCLVLALGGKAAWAAGGALALRETGATLPFVLPVYWLLAAVHRRTAADA